jgi:hypothetical protein
MALGGAVARGRGWVVGVERCSCLYEAGWGDRANPKRAAERLHVAIQQEGGFPYRNMSSSP